MLEDKEYWIWWLGERGWHTWYHPDYWVHPKLVSDKDRQDYTSYGMGIGSAVRTQKKWEEGNKNINS